MYLFSNRKTFILIPVLYLLRRVYMKLNKSTVLLVGFCATMRAVVPEMVMLQNNGTSDVYFYQTKAKHWDVLGVGQMIGFRSNVLPEYVLYTAPGADELKKVCDTRIERAFKQYDTTGELKAGLDSQEAADNALILSGKFPNQEVIASVRKELNKLTQAYNEEQMRLSQSRDKSNNQQEYETKSLKASLNSYVDMLDMYARELSPSKNISGVTKEDLINMQNAFEKGIRTQMIAAVMKYKSVGVQRDKFQQEKFNALNEYQKNLQTVCEQAKKSPGALLSIDKSDGGIVFTGASDITITGDSSLGTMQKHTTGETVLSPTIEKGIIWVYLHPNLSLQVKIEK